MAADQRGPKIGRPSYDETEIAARRQKILEAAVSLVPHLGSSNVRLKDIAAEAGVSVGTLQHYFDSRDELVEAAFAFHADRVIDSVQAAIDSADDPWDQVRALIARFSSVHDVQSRSALWVEFAAGSARDNRLRQLMGETYAQWRTILAGAVTAGITAGSFRPGLDTDQAVDGICALLDGYELANTIGAWREPANAEATLLGLIASILGFSESH